MSLLPPHTFTLAEQVEEVRRELQMRRQVYPNLVAARKMTTARAEHQIAAMQAVLETLERVRKTADDGK